MAIPLDPVRSALFLPASNPRAVAKARTLAADLVILDLEDAVAEADKHAARRAAVEAAADWQGLLAIRVNGPGSAWHEEDVAAVAQSGAALMVLPKVDSARQVAGLPQPVLAMIETPAGIYAAREIAAADGVAGLLAGSNDLAASLRAAGREGLTLALQSIVLAARAAGVIALDGVHNQLDDPDGFAADCRAGRAAGFDGKCLIHPDQVAPANRIFGPSPEEVEEARALVAAAKGGAERFRGRMIETMHVASARRILQQAGVA
ncbi:CoA ester lyase [uncultured Sphingomonas sp.]|uniref:HpcH/HpaI aldolase/citrate lyase family protein n=1 Tax=uncultured Sphingomonas sp. TaxID=158754 RepID=UPI0025E0C532|nr:CoA ester lyase [uncultured Sphingomonas sp.]